jgi:hypothetical protein
VVFRESGIQRNAVHRANFFALWHVKMAHTFGAFVRVNLVDFFAHVNRIIRALGLANVAIDTFVGDQ